MSWNRLYHIRQKNDKIKEKIGLKNIVGILWMTLYSMKTKEQIRKLAAVCSKHCFEVADKADVVWKDFRRV